jgi:hypothetical protein
MFIAVLLQFANYFIRPKPSPSQNVSMNRYAGQVCIKASNSELAWADIRIHRCSQNSAAHGLGGVAGWRQ